jgi:hypothetical protein
MQPGGRLDLDYYVRVVNDDGETVDEFDDADFTGLVTFSAMRTTLRQLHELVRRRVLGADQALDAILGQLED